MSGNRRTFFGRVLATIGCIVFLSEWGLHFIAAVTQTSYDMSNTVLGIGTVFGFVGFYMLSPPDAERAGGFLVTQWVRGVQVVRGGRRSTDVPVVKVEEVSPMSVDGGAPIVVEGAEPVAVEGGIPVIEMQPDPEPGK